jgi:hypothetical protein
LILSDHDRLVPLIQAIGETTCACVLLDVRVARVVRRKLDIIATTQQNRTRRCECVKCTKRAISNDQASTQGNNCALDTRIDSQRALRRPYEYHALAALFDRTRTQRLQDVDERVQAFLQIEASFAECVRYFDQCLLDHLSETNDELVSGSERDVREDFAHFARIR